ncbi:hypothetical protein Ocin01_01453 [Orchesella cincta]|uniref:Uncharacterized protein n=1 Tax=Orchesella cincta TaxID=48709 RepID=A0A1D2NJE2_ORCCI|nr:hypothetical protein Ocin01_01453 [Orchesella cincta]
MPSRVCAELASIHGQFSSDRNSNSHKSAQSGGGTGVSSDEPSVSNSNSEKQVERAPNNGQSSNGSTHRKHGKETHVKESNSNSRSVTSNCSNSDFGSTTSTTAAAKGKRQHHGPQRSKLHTNTSNKTASGQNASGQSSKSTVTSTEERHKELDLPIQNLYEIKSRLGKGVSNLYFISMRLPLT